MRRKSRSERNQLELFRALPGGLAPRDAQDLMAYPFFSLAKSKRIVPIDFRAGTISIRVEAVPEHGMATIWDADVLVWAASQIVEARHAGLKTSRLMAATPYEILTFVGRGASARDYDRLKASLDRLQATSVQTSIRQPAERRRHRFSWINEWKETADANGRPTGLELILPNWFYASVLDDALVLTIDRAYFCLTEASSAGFTGLSASTAAASRAAGVLIFCISTPSPAVSRRSSTLRSTCARSSGGRLCPAMNSSSPATETASNA